MDAETIRFQLLSSCRRCVFRTRQLRTALVYKLASFNLGKPPFSEQSEITKPRPLKFTLRLDIGFSVNMPTGISCRVVTTPLYE